MPSADPAGHEKLVADNERLVAELSRARWLYVQGDERVRRDVASMLHGQVQTKLLMAEMLLARAADLVAQRNLPAASEAMSELASMLEDVRVNDIRLASHSLYPPAIEGGLVAGLASLCSLTEQSFGVEIAFVASESVKARDTFGTNEFHRIVRLTMYRIAQDALANSVIHGRASHLDVELSWVEPNFVRMSVCDDGCGFDPATVVHGFGLYGAGARVAERGGSLSIDSSPGHGCRIVVDIPIRLASAGGAAVPFDRRAVAS